MKALGTRQGSCQMTQAACSLVFESHSKLAAVSGSGWPGWNDAHLWGLKRPFRRMYIEKFQPSAGPRAYEECHSGPELNMSYLWHTNAVPFQSDFFVLVCWLLIGYVACCSSSDMFRLARRCLNKVRGIFIVLCGIMFPVLIMNILISVLSARDSVKIDRGMPHIESQFCTMYTGMHSDAFVRWDAWSSFCCCFLP